MGIQINGQTDTISAVDGALTVSGAELPTVTNLNATGIVTATGGIVVGTGASVYSPATNVLSLGTNNTEKVRIDSSGNFNLVNTAGIMTAFKYETPALINNHFKSQSTTAGAYVRMYASAGSGQWDIYGNGANLRFSDNASSGNIQMDRPLSMNSQNIIMSSGYGIDFSATSQAAGMTSELLADYEVGTWTPTIYLGGTLQSYSLGSTGESRYTKIGNIVYLQFWMGFGQYGHTNFPTGSSSIFEIGGIPFAFNDNTFSASVGNARTQGGTSSNISIGAGQNSSRIGFWGTSGNYSNWVNQGFLSASSISSNADMILAGTIIYQT